MGLLWPIYIINFVDKTDQFVIPGTDTKNKKQKKKNLYTFYVT